MALRPLEDGVRLFVREAFRPLLVLRAPDPERHALSGVAGQLTIRDRPPERGLQGREVAVPDRLDRCPGRNAVVLECDDVLLCYPCGIVVTEEGLQMLEA